MANAGGKESKKTRIVEAALKLFSTKGFHAATTKEIAVESGVAEGLIFYYFKDKRTLLLHIVNNFSFALQLQGDEEPLELEESLKQYGRKYLLFLKEHSDYLQLIWSPEMIRDQEVSQEVSRLINGIIVSGAASLKHKLPDEQHHEGLYGIAVATFTSSLLVYFIVQSRFRRPALSDRRGNISARACCFASSRIGRAAPVTL